MLPSCPPVATRRPSGLTAMAWMPCWPVCSQSAGGRGEGGEQAFAGFEDGVLAVAGGGQVEGAAEVAVGQLDGGLGGELACAGDGAGELGLVGHGAGDVGFVLGLAPQDQGDPGEEAGEGDAGEGQVPAAPGALAFGFGAALGVDAGGAGGEGFFVGFAAGVEEG